MSHPIQTLRGRITSTWWPPLCAILLALPAAWPFITHPDYWSSHDGLFHLYRLLSLEEAWRHGHLYPRLFPDFAFGYGFAVLNFYGPLTYYVALALRAGELLSATGAMKATFALSYPLAALAIWWFARDLWRRRGEPPAEVAGLIAAAVYTYLPYHMADVQLRGALAESWAFVWWPLLFWATWRGRRWPLAVALSALVLTHNLSVALVALPLAAWALLALRGHTASSWPHLRAIGTGAALALLATGFYWLPLVLESRHIWLAQDVGGFGFVRHLAPWREWVAASPLYHYFPNQGVLGEHPLSWAQVGLLLGAFAALPWLWRSEWRVVALFWWATLGTTLFLLTPASRLLWQALVFPFGLVQYPWRWLGLASLATAMVVSATVARGMSDGGRSVARRGYLVLLGLAILWLAASSMWRLPWEPRLVDESMHPAPMWAEDAAAGQVGATWTAEFLPLTVAEQRWALARPPETVTDVGARTPLRVERAGSDGFTLWADVATETAAWLVFPRFAYPSMRATVDGEERPVEPQGMLGLAAVQVPAGRHRVTLEAYPLAARPWLAGILWLPPLALLVYGLARIGRRWVLAGAVGLLALLLATGAGSSTPIDVSLQSLAFGEQAQLLSLRHNSPTRRAGQPLRVTLLWFNQVQTDQRYVTFVHLTGPGGGAALAQHDAEPNMGTVPTSRWQPGQLVEDLHLLPLPDGLEPGEYELWGGIYSLEEGSAVPIP
ncbi:MAG: hypothetical protein H0V67_10955, partial [Geodermatophilaceae bacterium]|nr:hypothetical protein [Geodermatophilaceae bacterium]